MVSKRKQKKAEKKGVKTTMQEAMDKAESKKNCNDKGSQEKSNGGGLKAPKVSFGTVGKGQSVHIFLDDGRLLCTKRISMPVKAFNDHNDVTCKNCIKIRQLELDEVDKHLAEKKAETRKDMEKAIEAVEDAEQPEPEEIDDTYITHDDLTEMLRSNLKVFRDRLLKKVDQLITTRVLEILREKPDFIIVSKGNGQYVIIHEPSRHVIANNLDLKIAQDLLDLYIAIPVRWDGKYKPPQEWLTEVTATYEKYKASTETPQTKLSVRRKPKLTFRRKKKAEEPVKLKIRRSRKR